jgi:hypothetical protein
MTAGDMGKIIPVSFAAPHWCRPVCCWYRSLIVLLATLPAFVLRFNSKNLRELPIDLPEPPWRVVIVTPRKRASNPIAGRFIDCAREVATPDCASPAKPSRASAEAAIAGFGWTYDVR